MFRIWVLAFVLVYLCGSGHSASGASVLTSVDNENISWTSQIWYSVLFLSTGAWRSFLDTRYRDFCVLSMSTACQELTGRFG